MAQTFYVNPGTGSDTAAGSQSAPFKTIAKALQSAQSDTTIQLAPGNYNADSGETFPLRVPSGVKIVGNESNKGSGIAIAGSGQYNSRTLAGQNVTFLLESKAELRGVTVTNPATRGTAVWIESTAPTVANCTFTKSQREGVLATGDANPTILNNEFVENAGNGIAITRNTTGEIRGNTCRKTGTGITIDSNAAPKVLDNKIMENRYGIVVSGDSRAVLRSNLIENNTDDALSVTGKAVPNLGTTDDPGKNILRNSGKFDVNNTTTAELVSVGNQLNPSRTKGRINIDSIAYNDGQGSGGGQPPGGGGKLTDIAGNWAERFIQGLFDQAIVSGFGDGTFKPNDTMTRAEYAALLVKAFNPAPEREAPKFTDVPANFWAKEVIEKAYRGGFLSGFDDNTFRPNDKVQRVQVLVSLVNGLGLSAGDSSVLSFYDDRTTIPDYAKDEVATATKKKIVVNHPQLKKLNPTKQAARAEVAAMVYQALVDANRVSAINSDYIVTA